MIYSTSNRPDPTSFRGKTYSDPWGLRDLGPMSGWDVYDTALEHIHVCRGYLYDTAPLQHLITANAGSI